MKTRWYAWVPVLLFAVSVFASVPAMADPVEATISLGRDPEPPFCVQNPGGTLTITWDVEYATTPLRVIYTLTDPSQTIVLDSQTYPGSTGIEITRTWTVPSGLVDGKYWVRVEYWSLEAGNEANAEVTFYVCSEIGNVCAEKYADTNCNEVLDDGDLPVAGWWICIDTPYEETYCLQTGPDGRVCWNSVIAGEYHVWEFQMGDWRPIGPTEYTEVLDAGEELLFSFFNTECAPPSACCFPDGSCQVLPVGTCAEMGGTTIPDITCDPNPCPTACCFPYGDCVVTTAAECETMGGLVFPIDSCDPNPCMPWPYACCIVDECVMLNEADCLAQGGVWYDMMICESAGGDFTCPPHDVCCIGTDCLVLIEADCLAQGGEWHPEWEGCDPNPCLPVHVCCVNETCFIATETDCLAQGGEWHPEWDSCDDPNPCLPPTPADPDSWGTIKSIYR